MARENIQYFRLGRHALVAGLKLLKLRAGDRVLVPEFICRDLLAAIHAAGATPTYYAVDQALRSAVLPSAGQNVRAALAVNYFGFPQDLAPFRMYCEQQGATLIEDNAHGFLSHDEQGVTLGTRGDLGIFSIRKTFAVPDGGALVVSKKEWQDQLDAQLPCRSERLPAAYWAKHGLAWIQSQTGLRLLSFGQRIARHMRRWQMGYEIPPSLPEDEYEMPAQPAPHCRTLSALPRLDLIGEARRRRNLYRSLHVQLSGSGIRPIFGDLPDGVVPYGYPFYADANTVRVVSETIRPLGLECIRWPDLPAAIVPIAPHHYRSVWLINFLC